MASNDGPDMGPLELLARLDASIETLWADGKLTREACREIVPALAAATTRTKVRVRDSARNADETETLRLFKQAVAMGLIEPRALEHFEAALAARTVMEVLPVEMIEEEEDVAIALHPAVATQPPTPTPAPNIPLAMPAVRRTPQPRRTLSAFLAERNIRFGEILGLVLVIGCAIPLTVTYWSSFSQIGQYLLFSGVGLLFFAAGWYSLKAWKVIHASRSLLVISLLLGQLSVCVGSLVGVHPGVLWPTTLVLIAAAGVTLWLLWVRAGLLPLIAIASTMAGHLLGPMHLSWNGWRTAAGMHVFLAIAAAAVVAEVMRRGRKGQADVADVVRLLGLYAFASVLLVARYTVLSPEGGWGWADISIPLLLLAWPAWTAAALLRPAADDAKRTAAMVAGSLLQTLGGILTIFALVPVWSNATGLLAVSVLGTVSLLGARIFPRTDALDWLVPPYAALAYALIVATIATGGPDHWYEWIASSPAATWWLLPLPLVYMSVARMLRSREADGDWAFEGAAVAILTGLFVLCLPKTPTPVVAMAVLAAAMLAAAALFRRPACLYIAIPMLQAVAVAAVSRFAVALDPYRLMYHAPAGAYRMYMTSLATASAIMGILGYVVTAAMAERRRWRTHLAHAMLAGLAISLTALAPWHILRLDAALTAAALTVAIGTILLLTRRVGWWYALLAPLLLATSGLLEHGLPRAGMANHLTWHAYACALLAGVAITTAFATRIQREKTAKLRFHAANTAMAFTVVAAIMLVANLLRQWQPDGPSALLPLLLAAILFAAAKLYRSATTSFAGCAFVVAAVVLVGHHLAPRGSDLYLLRGSTHQLALAFAFLAVGWLLRRGNGETDRLFGRPLRMFSLLVVPVAILYSVFGGHVGLSAADAFVLAALLAAHSLLRPREIWGWVISATLMAGGLLLATHISPDGRPFGATAIGGVVILAMAALAAALARIEGTVKRVRINLSESFRGAAAAWAGLLAAVLTIAMLQTWITPLSPMPWHVAGADATLGLLAWGMLLAALAVLFVSRPRPWLANAGLAAGVLTIWWVGLLIEGVVTLQYLAVANFAAAAAMAALYWQRQLVRELLAKTVKLDGWSAVSEFVWDAAVILTALSAFTALWHHHLPAFATVMIAAGLLGGVLAVLGRRQAVIYPAGLAVGLGTVLLIRNLLPAAAPPWPRDFLCAAALLAEMWLATAVAAWRRKPEAPARRYALHLEILAHLFAVAAVFFIVRLAMDLPRHADAVTLAAHLAVWTALILFGLRSARRYGGEGFVYAAGLCGGCAAVVIAMHGRFALGWGWITEYWSLLTVAAAYGYLQAALLLAGRAGRRYSRPLLVLALAIAAAPLPLVLLQGDLTISMATWFAAAAVYGLAAGMRRGESIGYAAAAFANVGVVLALLRFDLDFTRHPQFFLIPPGLTLLLIGHRLWSRYKLAAGRSMRTFGLVLVFAAASADMLIAQTFG